MYEEGNKSLNINWGSLIIKLVILALIMVVAGLVYVRVTKNTDTTKSKSIATSNSEFINNINTMKNAAIEYFTESKLPEKVGATKKLTLDEMINQKLVIDFSNEGKTCDTGKSYVQATKTADENYALKVSLTCGKQEDFIVSTIEKKTCKENCTDNNKTNEVVDNKQNSNNNNTSNGADTNNSSTNNNTSNNNSSQNSSSSQTNKQTKTTVTTKTTTKVTIKVKCINGCCCYNPDGCCNTEK